MELTDAVTRPNSATSRPARSARGPVFVIAGLMIACFGGGILCLLGAFWPSTRPGPAGAARAAASRGQAELRRGRPDLAFEVVNQVRDDSPEAGEAMTVAGIALIRMGELKVARKALERALKLKPDQFETAVTLGELNLDLGDAGLASDALDTAVRLRPREYRVWRLLGRALGEINDIAGAARAYRKALELSPADRDVVIESLAFLIKSGQSESVDPWIGRALRQYPNDPTVLGLASRWAFDANRIDDALSFAEQTLQHEPANPEALRERARCLIARSRWKDALIAAEQAVATAPSDPSTLQLLLIAETRLGLTERGSATRARFVQVQDRARMMDKLIQQSRSNPDDAEIRWKMGQVALEAGSLPLAYRYFEAASALDPEYQPARESLKSLRTSHPELTRNTASSSLPDRKSPTLPPGR